MVHHPGKRPTGGAPVPIQGLPMLGRRHSCCETAHQAFLFSLAHELLSLQAGFLRRKHWLGLRLHGTATQAFRPACRGSCPVACRRVASSGDSRNRLRLWMCSKKTRFHLVYAPDEHTMRASQRAEPHLKCSRNTSHESETDIRLRFAWCV